MRGDFIAGRWRHGEGVTLNNLGKVADDPRRLGAWRLALAYLPVTNVMT